MKNAKAIKGQKALAMAVVAMFALCAFTVCIGSESDAGVYGGVSDTSGDEKINQTFSVDISVGQTFTYNNITTNLDKADGTITMTGSPTTADGANYTFNYDSTSKVGSFVASFTKAGTYVYTITANWDSGKDYGNVTQTATQKFTFNVDEKIVIPTEFRGYGIKGETQNVMNIKYAGPDKNVNITYAAYTVDGVENSLSGVDHFNAEISGDKLVVTPKDVGSTEGTYGLTITLTNGNSKDTASVNVIYQIFDDITITAPDSMYTYEGDTSAPTSINFTTNWDSGLASNQHISYQMEVTEKEGTTVDVITVNETDKRNATISGISGKTVGSIVSTDATKAVYTIKFTATGTVDEVAGDSTQAGSSTESESTTTLTVYKALIFASAPTIGGSTITPITATSTSINLSSYISGAYKVVFDWGDGTQTSSMDNMGKTATTYGAYHTYAKAGNYTITVYATNDQGTTTAQVFHSTDGMNVPADDTTDDTDKTTAEKEKSFIDKHGVQFIVFGILCILALVAFFYFGYQSPYVIIAAIILAALAVLCFVYHDISGIIDAFRK